MDQEYREIKPACQQDQLRYEDILANHTYQSKIPVLFNIRTGEMRLLQVTTDYMAGFVKGLLQFTKARNHVIAYDFETTDCDPYTCDIIDYCFYDVNARVPVFNSLINPQRRISEFITNLTGITNTMLQSAPDGKRLRDDIIALQQQYTDACLVAHNGSRFDHIILNRYAKKNGVDIQDLKMEDSLYALRLFGFHEDSCALSDLYKQTFGKEPVESHRARGDCITMSRLMHYFKIVDTFRL